MFLTVIIVFESGSTQHSAQLFYATSTTFSSELKVDKYICSSSPLLGFCDSDTFLFFLKSFFFHCLLLCCLSHSLDSFISMSCPLFLCTHTCHLFDELGEKFVLMQNANANMAELLSPKNVIASTSKVENEHILDITG